MTNTRKERQDRIAEQGLKLPEKQAESLHAFAMTAIETAIRNYWQAKSRAEDAQRRFDSEAATLEAMVPQIGKDLEMESHWLYQGWADTFAVTFHQAESDLVDAIARWHGDITYGRPHRRYCRPCMIIYRGFAYIATPDAEDLDPEMIGKATDDGTNLTNLVIVPIAAVASIDAESR
jgi:hypothetical protein